MKPFLAVLVAAVMAAGGLTMAAEHGAPGPAPAAPGDAAPHAAAGASPPAPGEAQPVAVPVRFEPAGGAFLGHVSGGTVLLTPDSLILQPADGAPVRISVGQAREMVGEQLQPSVSHHYGPGEWRTDVPHYAQVRLVDVAPGIDLVVYGTPDGALEFDHVVAPGADPSTIRLHVEGDVQRDGDGLEIAAGATSVHVQPPVAYQEVDDQRVIIDSAFRVSDGSIAYALGAYDPTLPLVIDPIVRYSSYLGAGVSDYARAVKVGPHANPDSRTVVVAGYQTSGGASPPGFPLPTAHGSGGGYQAWVAAMERNLATGAVTPMWFATLGGSSTEYGYDVAIGPNGEIGLVGYTSSTNLPTLNGVLIGAHDGNMDQLGSDAYAAVLSPSGTLLFSTYLGGSSTDYAYAVGFGPGGHLLVAGRTNFATTGPNFPTVNAPQPAHASTSGYDAFAVKIDTSTSPATAVFSTLIGGSGTDYAYGIAEDSSGVTFAGYTTSSAGTVPFPVTPGAYQTTASSGYAAYVAKLPPGGGTSWTYATLFDFSGTDYLFDMALDAAGNPWFTGYTSSSNLATTTNAFDTTKSGTYDAYVAALAANGASQVYGSFIGGTSSDYGYGIGIAPNGDIVLTGYTFSSSGFPTVGATQPTFGGGTYDTFVARVASSGALQFSTYLGGSGTDYGRDVAVDDQGNIHVTGYTYSSNFPTLAALQGALASSPDGFVTVYGKAPPTAQITADAGAVGSATAPPPATLNVPLNTPVTFTAAGSTAGAQPISWADTEWEVFDGPTMIDTGSGGPAAAFVTNGADLELAAAGTRTVCVTVWDTDLAPYDSSNSTCIDVTWIDAPPTALFSAPTATAIGAPVTFTDLSTDDAGVASWSWLFGDSYTSTDQDPTHTYAASGTYTVSLTVTDTGGQSASYERDILVTRSPVAVCDAAASPFAGAPVDLLDLSIPGDAPITSWSWDFGDGDTSTTRDPSHTYSLPGTYTVSLTVGDGSYTHTGTCTVTVIDGSPLPKDDIYSVVRESTLTVAAPGVLANDDDPTTLGLTASLAVDVGNGVLALQDDGGFTYTPDPGFTGVDTFQYEAVGLGATLATVTITVSDFAPPAAAFTFEVAGRQVMLYDLSQPGDGAIASWAWDFGFTTSPVRNPVMSLPGGTHRVSLTVTDANGLSDVFWLDVTVPRADQELDEPTAPPVADAGADQDARAGDTVLLSGSASGQARVMHYEWTQVGGPAVVLTARDTATPSFVAPTVTKGEQVVLSFALVVHNGVEFSEADLVHITIGHVNRAPTAVVPVLMTIDEGTVATIDAGASQDPDGDDLMFTWSAASGRLEAVGQVAMFQGPVGTHLIQMHVSDGALADEALIEVIVRPLTDAPKAAFEVVLRGQEASFIDQSIGGAQYTWDFGDGTTSHLRHPTHTFAPGEHYVELTVTDSDGDQDTMAYVFTVDGARDGAPQLVGRDVEAQSAPAHEPILPGVLAALGIAATAALLALAIARRR